MLSRWIFNRSSASFFGNLAVLAFLVAQALDGVLTYVGLTSAKLLAAALGIVLHLSGVHRLVALLTGIYLAAAVLPWTALLLLAR